jgi:SAM-dependent methyltransferase
MAQPAPILTHLTTVADPVRCRLLRILERRELTVSELCAVVQLPQSTVSRHLKALADDDWIASRPDGTSRLYSLMPDDLADDARRLWSLVREQISRGSTAQQDENRLRGVLARRRTRSREFFATEAGQWDKLRGDLFGQHAHLQALIGLVDPSWVVGDLGCGTGQITFALTPFVREVIAVDGSSEMLNAAKARLRGVNNATLRVGELDALPIEDATLDAAVLMLVLHYVPEPARALAEASRAMRPGGRLLVVDMMPHDRQEYQRQMGHQWLGFSEKQITQFMSDSGFDQPVVHPLPPDSAARGPNLFVATARRRARMDVLKPRTFPLADTRNGERRKRSSA